MPSKNSYLTFTEWAKKYKSELLYVNVFGTNIVILNSLRVINELLDKKSSIYSSRPQRVMVSELMGWSFMFATMPYGRDWRRRRSLFQRFFPTSRADAYQPQQRAKVRHLLSRLCDSQQNFVQTLRHFTGGIVIALGYGIQVNQVDDPYIKLAQRAIGLLNDASTPGKYLVDMIPWLKYIPDWFPGAKFKRDAKEWRKATEEFKEAPFQATKLNMEKGIASISYAATCLENLNSKTVEERLDMEELIKDTAATFYGGGTDTILCALLTFILAMKHFPSTQIKAQEELDRVIGPDRLPDFSDASNLPYVNALIREVFRWQPISPIALPHRSTEDDIFEGYFIPKGSIMIPNSWIFLHDVKTFPNPTEFIPERFLTPSGVLDTNVLDPFDVAFGYGRRICPGMHMARSTVYIVITCILHTMQISKPPGDDQPVEYLNTVIRMPKVFKCDIEPRSKSKERLIQIEALAAHEL
ncbi:hypothetical protein AGABI2DRAFT_226079 [Agaricus bisporus var. bisporus H97]|uniref:hypothetical protein n=1 Tax=Agaricus bisporus var. bisporus (strain H97 / ATCC MYA-4626 / FGSC 10389) TaxID=936046 RepID=UPI00029F79B0|nr:hypothetical protein AGABI2DRAFT_226079 [Agaricus bisporus var. bisporus H97]EKV44720.1 hypothetical protein AGABI2DRAFT_226079 [Agaricus bisporus var. bisporus H97]